MGTIEFTLTLHNMIILSAQFICGFRLIFRTNHDCFHVTDLYGPSVVLCSLGNTDI
jgi:hypothetical protein